MNELKVELDVCPKCEQGRVIQVEVLATHEKLFVCEECEATWDNRQEIGSEVFHDLGTFLEQRGLKPLWTELDVGEFANGRT